MSHSHFYSEEIGHETSLERAWGDLRTLDLTDVSVPMHELRQYLVVRYQERFTLDPTRFEHVVAGVFADHGFTVRVTARSHDKGIDVAILDGKGGETIGVQVKRYKGKIEPEQIRSFAGALVLNGMTEGIFVTTSSFTAGAKRTAKKFGAFGIPVRLVDADAFYRELQLTQRPMYTSASDATAPYAEIWKKRSLPMAKIWSAGEAH